MDAPTWTSILSPMFKTPNSPAGHTIGIAPNSQKTPRGMPLVIVSSL